jgi:hypothetical protein
MIYAIQSVHFGLIQIDLLLVVDELLQQPLQRLIYVHTLIAKLRRWGRIADIWHAIDISLFEGVIFSGDVLLSLAKLFCVFSSYLVILYLSNSNYDIL